MRDVVERAGVNERMLYEHFGSKEGLYRAVLEEQSADIGAAWTPMLERAATLGPQEGLRGALRAFFDLVSDRPLLAALLAHEGLSEETLRTPVGVDQVPVPLRGLFKRGQEEGVFRTDSDFALFYTAAMVLLTALSGPPARFADLVGERPTPRDREQLRDQLVDLLLDGLTGPGGQKDQHD
ncbi:TetR/AcrR family transcriptional regulator [Dactylosporangium roseum]|uniref:TetR/AcrR family transcriptional regulator n=1 Tax=Dactylosporangium roseum TaxID=47989 RepID=UPI0021B163F7|nr:TetR/AcrR family transcriptional regulator [Dactylosporangium roseum]